jgi:site-specific DNA-methyltransferase (adenine-specific)
VVRAVLPLGEGFVLDPFAGAGSTLAAAEAVGYPSVGVEKDEHYFKIACQSIPKLIEFHPANGNGKWNGNGSGKATPGKSSSHAAS